MKEFAIGIGASLVATFLIYLSRSFWLNTWHLLFRKLYPSIAGTYEVHYGNKERQKPWFENQRATVELKQYGKKLNGSFKVYSNIELKLTFDLHGFVTADKITVLNYCSPYANLKGAGSFVLPITGLSDKMSGVKAYVCSECDDVHVYPVDLRKIEA